MLDNEEKLKLTNLIDIKLLQELQDNFAKAMNVASIVYDREVPVTNPSNFVDFCIKYTRGSKIGAKRCKDCDLKWGNIAAKTGKPVIYNCHNGLVDFVVPIIVEGQHIGSFFAGQIFFEPPNEDNIRQIAREIGVNEDEYVESVRKVKIIPEENIKAAADLLYIVANTISEIAHKNLELIKKNKRETILSAISNKIRSSLDIDETLTFICEETMKLFSVQRASISELLELGNNESITRKECVSSSEIVGLYKMKHFNQITKYYIQQLSQNTKIISIDNILASDTPDYFKESYNLLGVKSLLVIPIQNKDDKWGALILSKYNSYQHWTNDDIELAQLIASQIYIAIKHAELYKKEKETTQKETILRDIIRKIRSSLDIKQIQHEIVYQIGAFFNADGVRIADYNYELKNYIVSKESEYRSSDKLKSWVGVSFKDIQGFPEYVRDVHLQGEDIIFSDLEKHLDKYNLRGTGVEKFYKDYGFVSSAAVNIYYGDKYVGDFVVTFEHPREFSDDEIQFLKTLADEAGTAFHQAELYEKEKKTAERERILRDMSNKIRKSLDIKNIKHEMVNQIAKFLKADKVNFSDYDYESGDYHISEEAEYRSSEKVKSHVGVDFKNIPGFVDYIREVHLKGKDIIFNDLDKYLDENNLRGTGVEKFYREFGFGASAAINIYYRDIFLGDLVITFNNQRNILDEEINFVKALLDQAGVAIYQARLFGKEQKTAKEETFLRKTTEVIRTSLDKNTIKHLFVTNIGKYFNADRAFFSDFDPEHNMYLPIDENSEYLSSPEQKSFVGYDWSDDSMLEYIQPLIEKKELNISCLDEYVKENSNGQNFVSRFEDANVKSSYNFPVLYQEEIMGFFCMEFTRDACKKLSVEDINIIRHLCTQAGIALYHSRLYAKARSSLGQNGIRYI